MLLHTTLALVHIFAAAPASPERAAPTAPSDQAVAVASPEEARSAAAKQHYSEQRYVEAARAYEALYGEFSHPKYLFNAAVAHEGAGQDAHAYVALCRFLDHPGLSAEDQARGETRLAPLRRRTEPLQLELSPSPWPEGLELELRRPGVEPLRLDKDALAALDRRGVIELRAESGDWSVRVQAPGYRTVERSVQMSMGGARTLLQLEPVAVMAKEMEATPLLVAVTANFEPAEAVAVGIDVKLEGPRPQFRRVQTSRVSLELAPGNWTLEASSPGYRPARLSFIAGAQNLPLKIGLERFSRGRTTVITLGTLAGTAFVAGAIVAGVYARKFTGIYVQANKVPTATADLLNDSWFPYHHGTRVMGAGVGLGLGAITKAFEHKLRNPRRAWLTEMLVGCGLTAVGAGLAALPRASYRHRLDTDASTEDSPTYLSDEELATFLNSRLYRGGGAEFASGVGIGLATSAIIALIQLRIEKGQRKRPARGLTSSAEIRRNHE